MYSRPYGSKNCVLFFLPDMQRVFHILMNQSLKQKETSGPYAAKFIVSWLPFLKTFLILNAHYYLNLSSTVTYSWAIIHVNVKLGSDFCKDCVCLHHQGLININPWLWRQNQSLKHQSPTPHWHSYFPEKITLHALTMKPSPRISFYEVSLHISTAIFSSGILQDQSNINSLV